MAIFPEYAMPKYKSPIRITKPYIKPNYIADAIIGGIGAYTNMQGMNLKKQMFMAQMAQQQKAIADQKARDQMVADLYTQSRTGPGRTDAGIQGYLGDAGPNFTQPMGISAIDQSVATALAGGANPMRALSIGQALYPQAKQLNAPSYSNLLAQTKWEHKLATDATKADKDLFADVSNMVGEILGKPLKDDFKYKDFVLKNEDFHGAAAQDEYLKNIEWQGLQGVPAYQKIITDTTQHVYNLLKSGRINKQEARVWLLQMASGSVGDPLGDIDDELKRARTPTIPAALQEHIDDLKRSNTSRRDSLPTPR